MEFMIIQFSFLIIGKGNITSTAEFNFYSDPEGAKVVLEEWNSPILWVPKEICDETAFDWVST